MSGGVQSLLRIGRNTADLDRAVGFYRDALGFQVTGFPNAPPAWARLPRMNASPSRCARLMLGTQQIELTEFPDASPYPHDSTSCDLWFQHCAIVVDDISTTYQRVMAYGADAITQDGPQTLPPSTGPVTAFKFRDPDGHPLELIQFPPGSNDPEWQSARTVGPFLGIDHSAIGVSDVQRSIRFYQLLGLRVSARGVNRGVKQQRLDDLENVEVDVIAMEPGGARTPHLELLGYRRPSGRVNRCAEIAAIAADRLIWRADDVHAVLGAIADTDFAEALIASGPLHGAAVALLRDPDGHWLSLLS